MSANSHDGGSVNTALFLALLSQWVARSKRTGKRVLPRLPLALFDPTVRVRVLSTGGDGADLTATNVRVGLWLPPREAPLETVDQAALRTLRQQARTVESDIRQRQWELNVFGGITVPPRSKPEEGKPPPPSPQGRAHGAGAVLP